MPCVVHRSKYPLSCCAVPITRLHSGHCSIFATSCCNQVRSEQRYSQHRTPPPPQTLWDPTGGLTFSLGKLFLVTFTPSPLLMLRCSFQRHVSGLSVPTHHWFSCHQLLHIHLPSAIFGSHRSAGHTTRVITRPFSPSAGVRDHRRMTASTPSHLNSNVRTAR